MNKKILCVIMIIMVVAGLNVQPVKANVLLTTMKPAGINFTTAWERSIKIYSFDDSAEIGLLCCGYNTVLINEDYVWTDSSVYSHKSYINNALDERYSMTASSSNWAKLEVIHYSNFPVYGIELVGPGANESNNYYFGTFEESKHKG